VGEGSSNITMLITIPVYSFTDKLHCQINTVTALLELLTDFSIRVSRSFITKVWVGGRGMGGGHFLLCPLWIRPWSCTPFVKFGYFSNDVFLLLKPVDLWLA